MNLSAILKNPLMTTVSTLATIIPITHSRSVFFHNPMVHLFSSYSNSYIPKHHYYSTQAIPKLFKPSTINLPLMLITLFHHNLDSTELMILEILLNRLHETKMIRRVPYEEVLHSGQYKSSLQLQS
jgi:hypothetical protein